jgi:hypothetical protein
MKHKNLTQYIFEDDHEEISDEKGRIILIKDPDTAYSLPKEKLSIKVKGSVINRNNLKNFSKIPRAGQYLITLRGFFIFGKYSISDVPIRKINRFDLSDEI